MLTLTILSNKLSEQSLIKHNEQIKSLLEKGDKDKIDVYYINMAIQLSREGWEKKEGAPFGCVITKDNEIVALGWNQMGLNFDPSAHGQIVTLRRACQKLKTYALQQCVLYTNAEPCHMCAHAIKFTNISRVVFAVQDQQMIKYGIDNSPIHTEVCKPYSQRKTEFKRIESQEAIKVFQDFAKKKTQQKFKKQQ